MIVLPDLPSKKFVPIRTIGISGHNLVPDIELLRLSRLSTKLKGNRLTLRDVVVDNTNTQMWEMSPYVLAAESYYFDVEIITLLVDPKIAHGRNLHGVPLKSVISMAERLERERLLPWWKNTIVRQ